MRYSRPPLKYEGWRTAQAYPASILVTRSFLFGTRGSLSLMISLTFSSSSEFRSSGVGLLIALFDVSYSCGDPTVKQRAEYNTSFVCGDKTGGLGAD